MSAHVQTAIILDALPPEVLKSVEDNQCDQNEILKSIKDIDFSRYFSREGSKTKQHELVALAFFDFFKRRRARLKG